MAIITEEDRLREYENIKEILDELDVAAEILRIGDESEMSCMMISLPTEVEDWREEYKTDLHMATAHLIQLSEDQEQLTKYLMVYVPVQVDLRETDELEVLRLINRINNTLAVGTCFYGKEPTSERMLLQIKWMIGGRVDENLDEGVVCEAIYELGATYDRLKAQLLELAGESAKCSE
ncbi:MAG: hypothetical protein ACI4D5_05075 [Kineothrix sp.]